MRQRLVPPAEFAFDRFLCEVADGAHKTCVVEGVLRFKLNQCAWQSVLDGVVVRRVSLDDGTVRATLAPPFGSEIFHRRI